MSTRLENYPLGPITNYEHALRMQEHAKKAKPREENLSSIETTPISTSQEILLIDLSQKPTTQQEAAIITSTQQI